MIDRSGYWPSLLTFSGLLFCGGAVRAQQPSTTRPNILFILTDDQRWDAAGYAGNPVVKTPIIDSLAHVGLCFLNAFVTTPISAASRASLLTGMYERTHGYTFRQGPLKEQYMQQSYPVLLRQNGYTTAYFGKFGVTYPGAKKLFDVADHYDRRSKYPDRRGYFYQTIAGDTVHLTRYTGYEAVRFLREADLSKPFCLTLGFSAPHAHDPAEEQYFWQPESDTLYSEQRIAPPRLAEDRYFESLPEAVRKGYNRIRWGWRYDTPEKYQHSVKGYYRMISEIDREIGTLRQILRERGIDRNTIIIFMGDNGGYATGQGWRDAPLYTQNYPLKCGKGSAYEGGIREPMIVCWPGVTAGGTRCDSYVMAEDIYPSILEMAGVKRYSVPQIIDGRSFVPLLDGSGDPSRGRDLFWNFPNIWGETGPGIGSTCTVRSGDWKLVYFYETGVKELYNIADDIGEEHNLAPERPDLVRKLSSRLGKYLRKADAQRPSFKATGLPCPWPDEVGMSVPDKVQELVAGPFVFQENA